MEKSAWANSLTAFSKVSAAGAASVAVVPVVLGGVLTPGVEVAGAEAVVLDVALAAGAVVAAVVAAGAVVVLGAPVVWSAVVAAGDVAGVAEPVPVLAAGWPKPSAWKAAIMALTRLFSRNFGRSSASWSDDFTAAVAAVEVDVDDVAETGKAPAIW
jgi:hypothetical protein